MTSLIQISQT